MGLYADFATALDRAMSKAAAPESAAADLIELLQLSAGVQKSDGETEYRPFYTAAKFLEQSRRDQTVVQDGQTRFSGQVLPIASMLGIQAALDQELIVPLGFEAIVPARKQVTGNQLDQLKTGYDAALLTLKKYLPRP